MVAYLGLTFETLPCVCEVAELGLGESRHDDSMLVLDMRMGIGFGAR